MVNPTSPLDRSGAEEYVQALINDRSISSSNPIPRHDLADKVRTSTYGRDVREAIAEAIEYAVEMYDTALKSTDIATVAETKNYLGITHS